LGLVQQHGKSAQRTQMQLGYSAVFDWRYQRTEPELARLYEAAKKSQWNAATDLDWSIAVDPEDPERPILPDSFLPLAEYPGFQRLTPKEKARQRHLVLAWMLSQFLHGEQGALFAACQVTEAVPWLDAELYGATEAVPARTAGGRGPGPRGVAALSRPLPRARILRGALGACALARGVGPLHARVRVDGDLPAHDVQAHRPQPEADRAAFPARPAALH